MTDEQINERTALLCGWRKEFIHGNGLDEDVWIHPNGKDCYARAWFPNYAADLNACHEFEKTLTHINDWMLYDKALAETTEGFNFHATARQRCEAFLRVHGQWEEEA